MWGKRKICLQVRERLIVQYVAKGVKTLDMSGKIKRECVIKVYKGKCLSSFKESSCEKSHRWAANRYQKLLVPLGAGSSRGLLMCIQLYFNHPEPMPTRRNHHSGLRNTWRLIFQQFYWLMNAVLHWMVQMEGVLDGPPRPNEAVMSAGRWWSVCSGPESWEVSWWVSEWALPNMWSS